MEKASELVVAQIKKKSFLVFFSVLGEGEQSVTSQGAESNGAGEQGKVWASIYKEPALPSLNL